MNTLEFNKLFGAATAALLVFLLAGFVSEQVFAIHDPETPGFAVAVAEAEAPADAPAEEDFATVLASVDPAAGAAVFRKCAACHKLEDGANGVGPHLYGVVGRDVGSVAGFGYSGALTNVAQVWGFDELNAFLTNPKAYAPGTSMGFAGLGKIEERAQVIAYLNNAGPSPLPLPEPAAAAEEAPAEAQAETAAAAPEPEAPAEAAPDASAEAAPDATAEAAPEATAEAAPEASAEPAAPVDPLAVALANADPARGAEIYAQCGLCHMLTEGMHGIGPSLHGVVGREVGGVARFPYSPVLADAEGVWTVERLDALLADPAAFGGHAGYPALADAQARADVLAHVNAAVPGAAPLTLAAVDAAAGSPETAVAPETATPAEAPAPEAATAPLKTPAPAEAPAMAEPPAPAAEAPATAEAPAPAPEAPATAEASAPAAEAPAAAAAAPSPAAPAESEVAAAAPAPAESAPAPAASGDPFVVAYLAADPAEGQKIFRKCGACHRVEEGRNGVGPSLWGVVGREVGGVEGFKYSDALMAKGGAWDAAALNAFLENPKGWAPGTKMAFAGLKTVEERAAVVRYLNEADGTPVPIE